MKTPEPQTIDVETVNSPPQSPPAQNQMAVARVESGAVGRAMTIDELHKNLQFIRDVMRKEMKEGQDYGKIPGTGEKPTLLQPGAQKLLMTFNLTERVKQEVLREFPSMPMHREYEFTVTVCAQNGKTWDGVGTCSTLESKYRYRKAERRCPKCGKNTIIQGKAEYGGGWLCWKKKGGCDAHFAENEPLIMSQPGGVVENEDPADCWNTVRKMAFKRALVAAAINATNTSELWTQDVEEMAENTDTQKAKTSQNAPQRAGSAPPAQRRTPPAQSSPQPPTASTAPQNTTSAPAKKPYYAGPKARAWLIERLSDCTDLATEYFRTLKNPPVLLPTETLEDLPFQWIPVDLQQLGLLKAAITDFGNGDEAKHPYPANPRPDQPAPAPAKPKTAAPKITPPADTLQKQPLPPHLEAAKKRGEDWFFSVFCPIPHRGEKKADYELNPDTILSLYTAMKSGNEEAKKRLWGFARHWNPEPREWGGKTYPPSDAEIIFREALDAFVEWEEKHGKDTKGNPASPEPPPPKEYADDQYPEEESTPFD